MTIPLQSITFEQICAIANNRKPQPREADGDETTLRLILAQHRAGMCSVEQAIARAYRVGRERGGK